MGRLRGTVVLCIVSCLAATASAVEVAPSVIGRVLTTIGKVFGREAPAESRSVLAGIEVPHLPAAPANDAAVDVAIAAERQAATRAAQLRFQGQQLYERISQTITDVREAMPEPVRDASDDFFYTVTCTSALNTVGGWAPLSMGELRTLGITFGVHVLIEDELVRSEATDAANDYFSADPDSADASRIKDIADTCEQLIELAKSS